MLPITQLQKLSTHDQSLFIYHRSQSVHASILCYFHMCFQGGSVVSPGERNGNPLQYSFLENSMDRGAWWATVYGVAKSQTQLSMHTCISICLSEKEGLFLAYHNISMLLSPKNCFYCCFVAKSRLTLVIPWTVACQTSLSIGFPRQEYWSGLPFPSPGVLLNPGMELTSASSAGGFFPTESPGKPQLKTQSLLMLSNVCLVLSCSDWFLTF